MSGLPGRSFLWRRNLTPMACKIRRTASSGAVSFPRIAAMLRDRVRLTDSCSAIAHAAGNHPPHPTPRLLTITLSPRNQIPVRMKHHLPRRLA